MTENAKSALDTWVEFLSQHELPVLRQTERSLNKAHANIDFIKDREISTIVLSDPLMTVRVLAFLRANVGKAKKAKSDESDGSLPSLAHATQVLGMNPFFKHFEKLNVIEELHKSNPKALLQTVQAFRRAQRASAFAFNWAVWRYDPGTEEITMSALLYDLAEVLAWCFAPQRMQKVLELRTANPSIPNDMIEKPVFGFTLLELQRALCEAWHLPPLLLQASDPSFAETGRIQTVKLASRLARHSAQGWDNPALEQDFSEITRLLDITRAALMTRLGIAKDTEKTRV